MYQPALFAYDMHSNLYEAFPVENSNQVIGLLLLRVPRHKCPPKLTGPGQISHVMTLRLFDETAIKYGVDDSAILVPLLIKSFG